MLRSLQLRCQCWLLEDRLSCYILLIAVCRVPAWAPDSLWGDSPCLAHHGSAELSRAATSNVRCPCGQHPGVAMIPTQAPWECGLCASKLMFWPFLIKRKGGNLHLLTILVIQGDLGKPVFCHYLSKKFLIALMQNLDHYVQQSKQNLEGFIMQ